MRIGLAFTIAVAIAVALWAAQRPAPERPRIRPQAAATQASAEAFLPGAEARRLLADGALLIDVREPAELVATGKLAGAVNLPLGKLREQSASRAAPGLLGASADRPVILYCRSGNRAGQAAEILRAAGYESVHNLGGLDDALAAGLPKG